MNINFYPDCDDYGLVKNSKIYTNFWKKEGIKIISEIEETSGLFFKESFINAIIYNGISYSFPLRLQASLESEHKKGALIHELCHRLVVGNSIKLIPAAEDINISMTIHKHTYLILFDIWKNLYGVEYANKEVIFEKNLWKGSGTNYYALAWDWALSKNRETRNKIWKTSLKNK